MHDPTIFMLLLAVGFICFGAGRISAKEPSEDEMIRRLVRSKVELKLTRMTREQIRQTIDVAATRIVAKRGK